ncbi:MAG: hypothetical protein FWB75_04715 [Oscillospiraceae bacterium]|nr:hypothetical protein [Oscillospiraceae bacterium]
MKKFILVLIGLVPLMALGYLLHYLILTVFSHTLPPFLFISVATLVIWLAFGMISKLLVSSKWLALILLNAPAFVILLLVIIQDVILQGFWLNIIGLSTQIFYLPLIRLSTVLGGFLPFQMITMTLIFTISFILLILASWIGRNAGERVGTKTKEI